MKTLKSGLENLSAVMYTLHEARISRGRSRSYRAPALLLTIQSNDGGRGEAVSRYEFFLIWFLYNFYIDCTIKRKYKNLYRYTKYGETTMKTIENL